MLFVRKERCLILLALAVTVSMFVSCVTVPKIDGLDRVFVTNTKLINILPASCADTEIDGAAMLTVSAGGQSFNLLSYVQCDDESIYVSLMNDFGVEMGYLSYDGHSVDMDCPLLPPELKGVYIINDLQYAFYDVDDVKQNLMQSKLIFDVQTKDGVVTKSVYDGKKLIADVTIDGSLVEIRNYLRGYEYSMLFEDAL